MSAILNVPGSTYPPKAMFFPRRTVVKKKKGYSLDTTILVFVQTSDNEAKGLLPAALPGFFFKPFNWLPLAPAAGTGDAMPCRSCDTGDCFPIHL